MSSSTTGRLLEACAVVTVSAGVALIVLGHVVTGGLLMALGLLAVVAAAERNNPTW